MAEGFEFGQKNPEREARKEAILAALRTLIEMEKVKDPDFNISAKFVKEAIKNNPKLFLGIRTYNGVMFYFSQDLNFLRKKLGLPEIAKKNY
jgi:hypothetical protein